MTTMSGFDYRNIDIYEEDSFGPPPRFLVEGLNSEHDEEINPFDDDQPVPSPLAKLKAVFNSLRW
jgi:hypothetical protein